MVHAHCRSTSSILLLITGSICCCSAVICCRVASGIPSCTASVTGSVDWAGLLPQRLRFRAGAGTSELPAASSVLAPHRLRRLPSADSGAAAASADSGARGEASVMRRETAAARSRHCRGREGGQFQRTDLDEGETCVCLPSVLECVVLRGFVRARMACVRVRCGCGRPSSGRHKSQWNRASAASARLRWLQAIRA